MAYSSDQKKIEHAETWGVNEQAPSWELFRWQGRIGRLEYFWVILITSVVLMGLLSALTASANQGSTGTTWVLIFLFFPVIYISFLAGIKRCHDLGKSGWLYLAASIPLVNLVLGLYLLFAKGVRGSNQYGPHPSNIELALNDISPAKTKIPDTSSSHIAEPDFSTARNFTDNSRQISNSELSEFDEEAAYAEIARELSSKKIDQGMWLKAMVHAGSLEERQQTIVYTGLRLQKLRELFLSAKAINATLRVDQPLLPLLQNLPDELQRYLQVCGGNCPNCNRLIPDLSHRCAYCSAEFGLGSTWKILKFSFEGQIKCLKHCFSKGRPLKIEEIRILVHAADFDETILSLYNDVTWDTLLHVCVRLKLTYEVRSLLGLGANRNSENAERHKPLDLATTVEITDVLQESGEADDAL